MIQNNWIALVITLVIALAWLRVNDFLAHKGLIPSGISRKIIHIGTGPIFVLCWLFFSDSRFAPFLAAIIPLGITLQFALVGFGLLRDSSSVEAMSRTGNRREILRGPLYYGMAFVLLTILFWRHSPTGIVALMCLCGGDGMADLIGRRIKSRKLPWSSEKSLVGSLTMMIGGFVFSILILWVFIANGYFPGPIITYLLPIGLIAIVTTLVESLPFKDIDNITVPAVAVLLGILLF